MSRAYQGLWAGLGSIGFLLTPMGAVQASITVDVPNALRQVLEAPTTGEVISSRHPSQLGLTVPSLWWSVEQFGVGIVESWRAYPIEDWVGGRVDMVVSDREWARYGYFERFSLVNHLGTSASNYGYHLIIRDRRQTVLGAYICDFAAATVPFVPNVLDSQGQAVPDFVGDRASNLVCRVWLNPNIPISIF